ncbi:MaoC/PaaZ C-terminal domain-containing protein [Blastococcus tunisiensis]|uniref:Acyl dehydratase n=1 Tax=Blastococcus tunisiensis TaxID=1798228 RepID=A0A1I2A4B3_9ACTN|nr:MaoC/PaaZ C-terminal domain-containing protein [Blastococcus sp. DSM 46838]SFE38771.1 Acyl dehydratase [Blastococcus sp. DSM 46838]
MSGDQAAPRTGQVRDLYGEDIEVGVDLVTGAYTLTADEIVDFASVWDPQYFHVDAGAAAEGHFGGLIASGVHTLAVYQRLAVQAHFARWNVIAGRRIRDLRFLVPVRAGDRLTGRLVVDAIDEDDRGRAVLQVRGELTNQHGAVVMSLTMETLILMRPATP